MSKFNLSKYSLSPGKNPEFNIACTFFVRISERIFGSNLKGKLSEISARFREEIPEEFLGAVPGITLE